MSTISKLKTFENIHQLIEYGIFDIFLNGLWSNPTWTTFEICLNGILNILETLKPLDCIDDKILILAKISEFDCVGHLTEILENGNEGEELRNIMVNLLNLIRNLNFKEV